MSIAEFLNLISKNYVSACSLFSPIYDHNKKRRASALKILEHIKKRACSFRNLCITPSSRYREKAISHGSQDSFLEWLKSRGRRCRRPAPLKCCIYYKVEPVLVLGKPRPTKGRPARAPLRSDKGKNSVRGWRRPRSAALYALFHHRFFSFHNEKISKVFDHQKKNWNTRKNQIALYKEAFSEILIKKKKTRNGNC